MSELAQTARGPSGDDGYEDLEELYEPPEDDSPESVENFIYGCVKRFNQVETVESVNRRATGVR